MIAPASIIVYRVAARLPRCIYIIGVGLSSYLCLRQCESLDFDKTINPHTFFVYRTFGRHLWISLLYGTVAMRYVNSRFLLTAMAGVLIVLGSFLPRHAVAEYIGASILMASAMWPYGGLREIRTGTMDFYGSMLLKSAFVVWSLAEGWHIGALAAFLGLNLTVDIQFSVVGLHLYSTDIRLSVPEIIAVRVLVPLAVAAMGVLAACGCIAPAKWVMTAAFTADCAARYFLLRRIKKRI